MRRPRRAGEVAGSRWSITKLLGLLPPVVRRHAYRHDFTPRELRGEQDCLPNPFRPSTGDASEESARAVPSNSARGGLLAQADRCPACLGSVAGRRGSVWDTEISDVQFLQSFYS